MPFLVFRTRLAGLTAVASALLLVLCPDAAQAWGPGVHMVTGNWLLQNLSLLPGAMALLLGAHSRHFVHGLLSPDIFIGKGCKAVQGHSHNWESGFSLLERARQPRERAFALGYLSHLAADTVAHNLFVPGLLHTLPGAGKWAHVYLEIQADRLIRWDSGPALLAFKGRDSKESMRLLGRVMRQKTLPFWMKKSLYTGSMSLGGSAVWRQSMGLVDRLVTWRDRKKLLNSMLHLSTAAVIDLLRHERGSALLDADPIGEQALANATQTDAGRAIGVLPMAWRFVTGSRRASTPELRASTPAALRSLDLRCRSEWL
ncbi:zinc dependent phospholipase C family protein [Desulfovibrio sp. OttesenSCG-928-A18]|nr:zinc dependent phospholipase C family protein [Desulfovibrio sp. OttesenSCG-928-A18]